MYDTYIIYCMEKDILNIKAYFHFIERREKAVKTLFPENILHFIDKVVRSAKQGKRDGSGTGVGSYDSAPLLLSAPSVVHHSSTPT